MAMGHIFCIMTDADMDISFNKSIYEGMEYELNADYFKDLTPEQAAVPLNWLKETVTRLGGKIYEGDPRDCIAFSFSFTQTGGAQADWFRPRLEQLKKEVEELTLPSVIQSAPALDRILDNQFGDRVALYGTDEDSGDYVGTCGTVTFDGFIRKLQPGTVYYVHDRMVLMH